MAGEVGDRKVGGKSHDWGCNTTCLELKLRQVLWMLLNPLDSDGQPYCNSAVLSDLSACTDTYVHPKVIAELALPAGSTEQSIEDHADRYRSMHVVSKVLQ